MANGQPPAFVTSLTFNGRHYVGAKGRSKKESQQLAARDVILSILEKKLQQDKNLILLELNSYLMLTTTTTVIVDKSSLCCVAARPHGPDAASGEWSIGPCTTAGLPKDQSKLSGPLSAAIMKSIEEKERDEAHLHVLLNNPEVYPYIMEIKEMAKKQKKSNINEDEKQKEVKALTLEPENSTQATDPPVADCDLNVTSTEPKKKKPGSVKAGRLDPDEDPDRAILWKMARKPPKDEIIDEDLAEKFEKIDELLEKKKKGEFKPSGSEDVLTIALETPEHSGRVRGVGSFAELKAVVNASNINSPMSCKASCRGDKEEQEEQEEHDEDDGCVAIGPVDPSPPEKR
ncbi:hypothetical protein POM88_001730 [Heracleum sosnowskyi]|uniref:DRBM domain-containing protein n=1 Tax=Heracleum sosnowskyi TaxID=360622 RepID=A0AAD8JCS3_9APIA|nr:hypothetical protein POM88_001730 [Heracleum sosnowskyi]